MNGSVFLYVALLHHDFMLSSLMVSRQISYSACVCIYLTPPFCHFGGSDEEVAVKSTPLPPLQPPPVHLLKLKTRSNDTGAPGALLSHDPARLLLCRGPRTPPRRRWRALKDER